VNNTTLYKSKTARRLCNHLRFIICPYVI
jgi:hypothetical protein